VGWPQPSPGEGFHPAALDYEFKRRPAMGTATAWPIENQDLRLFTAPDGAGRAMASVMALPQLPDWGVFLPPLPYNPGGAAPGPRDR